MNDSHRDGAARTRALLERARSTPELFRARLVGVPAECRDAWIDMVFGLDEIPADGPDLPRGCAPYLPCSVDAVLRMVDQTPVRSSDVFVDVGSGLGRAAILVHLLTGASAIGLEVQSGLVIAARDLARRLGASGVSTVHTDAAEAVGSLPIGTVYFLYCPFSGDRLVEVLAHLEPIARARMIHVCCVDLPLPPCRWLTLTSRRACDLAIYRSTLHDDRLARPLGAAR